MPPAVRGGPCLVGMPPWVKSSVVFFRVSIAKLLPFTSITLRIRGTSASFSSEEISVARWFGSLISLRFIYLLTVTNFLIFLETSWDLFSIWLKASLMSATSSKISKISSFL